MFKYKPTLSKVRKGNKITGGLKMKKVLDKEWVHLILLAKELNLSTEEIKTFLQQKKREITKHD